MAWAKSGKLMKNILSHIGVAAVAVVATLLFVRGCSNTEVIRQTETIVKCTVDTVNIVDTFNVVSIKRVIDTVERVVYIDTSSTIDESLMTYEEHYVDSSYSVYGNIFYEGTIVRHDQMFVQNKEQIQFIPKTRTVFHTRDNIVVRNADIPRVYVGLYSTFDTYIPQQAGISIAVADNRHRLYTVGKDLTTLDKWSLDIKIPVTWSKK